MSLNIGIVGLPNVGKSTLFKAVTAQHVEIANYPFCTIEPNVGVVPVPDVRLDALTKIFESKKKIPNVIQLVDIAGLVKGASKGEGLGNQFLEHIRQVDVILEVIRCFDNDNVAHVEGTVDPLRDIDTINTEIIISDVERIDRRLAKEKKESRASQAVIDLLTNLREYLDDGKLASTYDKPSDPVLRKYLSDLLLLSEKPMMYVLNVDDKDIGHHNTQIDKLIEQASQRNIDTIKLSVKLESEMAGLNATEREEFLEGLGLPYSGLDSVIQECFRLLNQITFFTAGKKEVRAWNVRKGALLPEAAGKIHSDMEKHFIRGEVYHYDDIIEQKTVTDLKNSGKFRVEGKDYQVKDGDVLHIRFT